MKRNNYELIIVFLMCFLVISLIIIYGLLFIEPFLERTRFDDIYYVNMANDITRPEIPPFRYRILTPLIVYLLPFDYLTGFIIVNLSALYATSILFYFFLKKFEFPFKIRLIGVLLFLLNPIILNLIQLICYVDFLLFFFYLLAFYALLNKNEKLFLISVSLGIIAKEIIIIILILYFILKYQEVKKFTKALIHTAFMSVFPITIFLIIFIIYGSEGANDYLAMFVWMITFFVPNNLFYIIYLFYKTFTILWIIFLIYEKKLLKKKIENLFLKNCFYFIPFIILASLLATLVSRIVLLAFPIIIPLSLYIFEDKELKKSNLILILLLTILLFIVHFVGSIYFFNIMAPELSTYETVLYWIILMSFFEIFTIIIFTYLLIQRILNKKAKNKKLWVL